MASTTNDPVIQSLIDQGRRNGNRLSAEALGAALPVETMTPEETAAIVERIEAAGVEVELDDARLMRGRGTAVGAKPDYHRGDGVVDMANPAAPAVSSPGAVPSVHGWADDAGRDDHGHGHGHGGTPSWKRDGIELLPLASMAAVAVVMIAALG